MKNDNLVISRETLGNALAYIAKGMDCLAVSINGNGIAANNEETAPRQTRKGRMSLEKLAQSKGPVARKTVSDDAFVITYTGADRPRLPKALFENFSSIVIRYGGALFAHNENAEGRGRMSLALCNILPSPCVVVLTDAGDGYFDAEAMQDYREPREIAQTQIAAQQGPVRKGQSLTQTQGNHAGAYGALDFDVPVNTAAPRRPRSVAQLANDKKLGEASKKRHAANKRKAAKADKKVQAEIDKGQQELSAAMQQPPRKGHKVARGTSPAKREAAETVIAMSPDAPRGDYFTRLLKDAGIIR